MSEAPRPVSKCCPACQSTQFTAIRPLSKVAFKKDRMCSHCETRYTPPTPTWAAVFLGLIGLGFATFGLGILGEVAASFLSERSAQTNPVSFRFIITGLIFGGIALLIGIAGIRRAIYVLTGGETRTNERIQREESSEVSDLPRFPQ